MEWNDMSKGKWDVRSRLSAERNKNSLAAVNQEKALVGLFSVITNLRMALHFKL